MKKLMLLKFMLILSFNSANAQFVEPPKGGGMVNEGGIAGNDGDILQGREALKQHFELDETGLIKEYIGCKIDYNHKKGWMKLTQPVLL